MTSEKRRSVRQALGMALGFVCLLSTAGCDYWPPALQAQIEQMRSEMDALNVEKTQLQSQVNDLSRARQDLQIRFDELSRVSREKTDLITSLQRRLEAAHSKTSKTLASSKASGKSTAKSSAASPVKKKAAIKR